MTKGKKVVCVVTNNEQESCPEEEDSWSCQIWSKKTFGGLEIVDKKASLFSRCNGCLPFYLSTVERHVKESANFLLLEIFVSLGGSHSCQIIALLPSTKTFNRGLTDHLQSNSNVLFQLRGVSYYCGFVIWHSMHWHFVDESKKMMWTNRRDKDKKGSLMKQNICCLLAN